MNFYSLFYWFTVSDKVRSFFDVFSNIFTVGFVIAGIVYAILSIAIHQRNTTDEENIAKYWHTHFRRLFIWSCLLMTVTW